MSTVPPNTARLVAIFCLLVALVVVILMLLKVIGVELSIALFIADYVVYHAASSALSP